MLIHYDITQYILIGAYVVLEQDMEAINNVYKW